MDKKIFFGILLLALSTSPFVHANPLESANDDDDYLQDKSNDDDYDYDIEDKRKSSTVSTLQNTDEPYKTEEYVEKAEAGRRIELKCLGENLDHDTLYMWYNGSRIIAQGNSVVEGGESARLDFSKKNGLLIIKSVNAYDDGVFRCRAFLKNERYETIVQVRVNGPPKGISIGHNVAKQQNIAGNTLVYQAGHHDLRFKCNVAKARPEAKIDWIHNGNTILDSQTKDHDLKIKDEGVMIIKTLHARHAGDYQCEASNEFGQLKANFKIDVQYAPFFMHHHAYFNAEEGGEVELHCLYKAFPAPTSVRWLKGGSKIHDNEKYQISNDVREHHDRTKLLVKNVSKNDFVMYQCEVENELGVKRENVSVGFGPAPARFEGYKYINNIVYTDWVIKSHQQLTELQILYRNNAFGWRPKTAQITNRNEVREGEWKVQGSIELDAGEWEIMARAKNTEGWSDDRFSQEIPIKIPKDSIESQNQTSSASAIGHTMMGLVAAVLLLHRFA